MTAITSPPVDLRTLASGPLTPSPRTASVQAAGVDLGAVRLTLKVARIQARVAMERAAEAERLLATLEEAMAATADEKEAHDE